MPDTLQQLYQTLSNRYDLGAFDAFKKKMGSPESRSKLYETVSATHDLGNFSEFDNKVTLALGDVTAEKSTGFLPRIAKVAGRATAENVENLYKLQQYIQGTYHGVPEDVKEKVKARDPFLRATASVEKQLETSKPEKLLSIESFADFIGTGVADLPLIALSGGMGTAAKVIKGGSKAAQVARFLVKEGLAGATFAQARQYGSLKERLLGTTTEAAAWATFGGLLKGIGRLKAKIPAKAVEEGAYHGYQLSEDAAKVANQHIIDDSVLNEMHSFKMGDLYEKLKRAMVDVSGNVKAKLLKQGGDAGREAVIRKDLVRGAQTRAQAMVSKHIDNIYKGLKTTDEKLLNDVIEDRRIIAIDAYKEGMKHPGGLGGDERSKFLQELTSKDPARMKMLTERANQYFEAMRDQVKQLYKEGILSEEQFRTVLSKGDYSPRWFLKWLDPSDTYMFTGRKISVPNSGLKALTGGDIGTLEKNSRLLLSSVVARTQGRIFKNRANQALHKLAQDVPDNGIVRTIKSRTRTPAGYERVAVMVDGIKHDMVMPGKMAQEWVTADPAINSGVANIIGWISGSKILKPMATGLNPEFALTNFPRDIAHAWLVTGEYSPTLPKAALQVGRDLVATARDAFRRKGRWNAYIDEGGGMEFLTHQGRITGKTQGLFNNIQKVMGYLGETSEAWVRLALRERALRNGARPFEATWAARNYLDFAQGGSFTKAVDTAVPYLNAAVQGTRGIFRAAAENPATFTWKTAQLGAVASGLYMANKTQNPEAWKQVSARDKVNNFIVTTPLSYEDKSGNKRHVYFKIAKDQGQRVVTALFEAAMAKFTGDEDYNTDQVAMSIQDALPIVPSQSLPPTVDALLGYAANKDFWRNEDVWRGAKVTPREEYTNYTPPAYVKAGEITGLSPERTQYALTQYFTYGNIWTSLVGGGLNKLTQQLPKAIRGEVMESAVLKAPFVRRIARSTYPYSAVRDKVEKQQIEENTRRYKQNRTIDALTNTYLNDPSGSNKADVFTFIGQQPETDRKRLQGRFKDQGKLFNVPNRRWWLDLKYTSPEVRARIYWTEYTRASDKKKAQLDDLRHRVPGINSKRFRMELDKLQRRQP